MTRVIFVFSFSNHHHHHTDMAPLPPGTCILSPYVVPKPTVSAAAVPSAEDANGVHYIYVCSKGGKAEEGS